ncbi:MAG: hypoxanthine phosphoribosyltransferase [Pseudoflavonifractor sp.]|nr:hypoxanthine phosphoribosyltransferase [Pseudoflavonifractor sp.]
MLKDDIERVLISEEALQKRVAELGAQISADYTGKEPILVSVLRGSYIFMADLTRRIETFCRVDFMAVSSYGAGTVSSGQVNIIKDLSDSIDGKDVIVVEDILDSGNTLHYLFQLLQARHPASIRLATLLDKPSRRTKPITADYVGFEVPDEFVVGYGLDYDELYRNLPYIGVLKPRVYEETLVSD